VSRECTLRQLADLVGGRVDGDPNLVIHGLNGIDYAQSGEITFILDTKQLPLLEQCRASACIVPAGLASLPMPVIVAEQPSVAAARIHTYLLAEPFKARGIHPSAVVGDGCILPREVTIGPLACLGDRVVLGERVTIHPER